MKILTSKFLTSRFCRQFLQNPRPARLSEGMGEGGTPNFRLVGRQSIPLRERRPNFISVRSPQPDSAWHAESNIFAARLKLWQNGLVGTGRFGGVYVLPEGLPASSFYFFYR